MIIGIHGHIGSGKDYAAGYIQKLYPSHNWQIRKFAGKLKEVCALLTGIPVEDLESEEVKNSQLGEEWGFMTVREMLQRIGTDAMRTGLHQNTWVNATFSDYYSIVEEVMGDGIQAKITTPNWLMTDLRFKNEFHAIQKRNGINIKIARLETANQWCQIYNLTMPNWMFLTPFVKERVDIFKFFSYFSKDYPNTINNQEFIRKFSHVSERDLLDYTENFDYVISNDGTLEDFEKKIEDVMEKIFLDTEEIIS